MSEVFLDLVNRSISASWLILAVLILRVLLKKAPKWFHVLLWGIVAVRLVCPFSIESALSLIPSAETVSPEIMMDWTPEISTGIDALDEVVNPVITDSFAPKPWASANPLQILIPVAAHFWLLGVLVLVVYTAVSYGSLRRKLRTAVVLRENIFQCETVGSPFVLGIFRPRIYLPYDMDEKDLHHVVAHEQAHIARKDHWWKPLGFLLLTVHWFNPFVWVAYILLCRDIELACDEKVIAELGNAQRADYTQALVHCSIGRRKIMACPLAFGEVGVKERVKNVLDYKKPGFWLIAVAVVVCIAVAVCFLTDPKPAPEFAMNGDNLSDLNPAGIVDRIMRFQNIENSDVYMNADNFSLSVDSDFNWMHDQTIQYFYYEDHETRSGQLRIFPEENSYYLTQSAEWPEQHWIFLLRHYLDALKYLPQNEIRQMAPADLYLIEIVNRGTPEDYDKVISYSSEGIGETNGWYIHLRILPHHADGEGYSGTGAEQIDLFYGAPSQKSLSYVEQDGPLQYDLTIPCQGVVRIEVIGENSSGGCVNADGSAFPEGETISLEPLDGVEDLRGIQIVAYGWGDVILYAFSIPQAESPVNRVESNGWILESKTVEAESNGWSFEWPSLFGEKTPDDEFEFRKRDFIIIEESDTHGGFHGDGDYHLILNCSENQEKALEIVRNWTPLPFSENLELILYGGERDGMTYGFNLAERATIPRIENGCYLFCDRHSESTDSRSDEALFDRASFNFSLAVYDFDTDRLYYLEFDT